MERNLTFPTYFDRYLAGEHVQVWSDLVALGELVREKPVASDAWAVARETMRRARENIATLLSRLETVGYECGYVWMQGLGRESRTQGEWGSHSPYAAPPAGIADQLRAAEGRFGPLPLSVHAWFETIGMVDFVGRPPRHWSLAANTHSPDGGHLLDRTEDQLDWSGLDPLCIWTLEDALAIADMPSSGLDVKGKASHCARLPAPRA
jgi:hypothetical protein